MQNQKSKFFLFYLLIGVSSGVTYFTPVNQRIKDIATYGAVLGLAGLINTELVSESGEKAIEKEEKKTQDVQFKLTNAEKKHIQEKSQLRNSAIELKAELDAKITALQVKYDSEKAQLSRETGKNKALTIENQEQLALIHKLKADFDKVHHYNTSAVHELVREAYDRCVKNVESLIEGFTRFYPEHTEAFNQIVIDIDKFKSRYSQKVSNYESILDFQELLTEGIRLQEIMVEVSAKHRLKAQTIVISHLQDIHAEKVELNSEQESMIAALESAIEEANDKYGKQVEWTGVVKDRLEANVKGIAAEWVQTKDEMFKNYASDFQELLDALKQSVAEIQTYQVKIAELETQVTELSKPIQAYGDNAYSHAANDISNWYYQQGYNLDFWEWIETLIGYDLVYSIKKNPALSEQDLFGNNGKEQIAAFTNCLHGTEPKLDFNRQNSTLTLSVQLRKLAKKAPLEKVAADVSKIWIPASKFESYVSKFERVRITAGSTGGKSPTAKNLALAIMKARKGQGEIKLYDPQDGSKKDYWNMPKVGTSHKDNFGGMKEVCNLIDSRRHKASNEFVLYIFDEVDNTVTNLDKGSQFEMVNLVKTSLKESSHANIGVIYIGQSCDANEIPMMTHSNWNNAVGLHIGTNSGSVIDRLQSITSEQKTNLLNQYHKIQAYCEAKNEELGLDIFTDPTAYRFALVVPLSGLPKFIQLPDFDSYDYSVVMSINTQNDQSININTTPKSEVKSDKQPCKYCGSINVKRNGKHPKTGKQQYTCNDCKDTPRKWTV